MILAIETSSSCGSIALRSSAESEAAAVVWRAEFPTGRGHGGELFRALEEAMRRVSAQPTENGSGRLEEIIVGLGPGSYSGVRLALAAAAGLALATGVRLGGRPSPLALSTAEPTYHALGDARRGMFYYTAVRDQRPIRGPELLDATDVRARLLAEPAWPVFADSSAALDGLPEIAALARLCLPDAARLLTRPLEADEVAPAGSALTPIYLRAPTITLPKAR